VLALASDHGLPALEAAARLGAGDLLVEPVSAERLEGALQPGVTTPPAPRAEVEMPARRAALVSADPELAAQLGAALPHLGWAIEWHRTPEAALSRAERVTFHAALYDAAHPSFGDRGFADALRACSGMGLVPVVFLAEPTYFALFAGIGRSTVRPRREPPALLAASLDRLRAVGRGRVFVRYGCTLGLELLRGGRRFAATAVDASRGGLFARCERVLPLGTALSARIAAATGPPIDCVARVTRVTPPDASGASGIGLEIGFTAEADELAYVAVLRALATAASSR
jgi:hypothetical protein